MRRKLFISSLIVVLLFTLAPLSGVMAGTVNNNHRISFSAQATIMQEPGSATMVPLGGIYYKTTGEILTGNLGNCEAWPEISGASVYMENATYFTMDANYNVQGIDYATITFTAVDGSTIKASVIGTLSGNLTATAETTLYWTSTRGAGSFSNVHASGQINATFFWYVPVSDGYVYSPGAIGVLSGTVINS